MSRRDQTVCSLGGAPGAFACFTRDAGSQGRKLRFIQGGLAARTGQ